MALVGTGWARQRRLRGRPWSGAFRPVGLGWWPFPPSAHKTVCLRVTDCPCYPCPPACSKRGGLEPAHPQATAFPFLDQFFPDAGSPHLQRKKLGVGGSETSWAPPSPPQGCTARPHFPFLFLSPPPLTAKSASPFPSPRAYSSLSPYISFLPPILALFLSFYKLQMDGLKLRCCSDSYPLMSDH